MEISSFFYFLIPLIATVYIAHRQGAFKNNKFYFSPTVIHNIYGDKLKNEKLKHPVWLLVNFFKMSRNAKETVLYHVPLFLDNSGQTAIENINITLEYNFNRSMKDVPEGFVYSEPIKFPSNITRYSAKIGNTCTTTFEVPFISPRSGIFLFDLLSFDSEMFKDKSSLEKALLGDRSENQISLVQIHYQISAKNLSKPMIGSFWILNSLYEDIDEFSEKSQSFILNLHRLCNCPRWPSKPLFKKSKIYFVPRPHKFWYSLFNKDCAMKKLIDIRLIENFSIAELNNKKIGIIEEIENSKMVTRAFEESGLPHEYVGFSEKIVDAKTFDDEF